MPQYTNMLVYWGQANAAQNTATVYSSLITNLAPCVTVGWIDNSMFPATALGLAVKTIVVGPTNQVLITLDVDQQGAFYATNAIVFRRANQHGNLP